MISTHTDLTLEYITLGTYLLLLLFLGTLFARMNRNLSDFVRAGAQGTWWMIGTSMLMSAISAFTFTGNASAAFEAGPSVLIYYIANCTAFFLCFLFLGAWFRQTRAYTRADIVRARFGVAAEQFMVWFSMFLQPLGASIQLWALAVFASSVFGFNLQATIIGVGFIVLFYSATGGRWAVMATDFLQSMILFSITILMAVLALIKIGGVSVFFDYFSDPRFSEDFQFINETGHFDQNRFSPKWMIAIYFMALYSQIGFNSVERFLSAKDGLEARRGALLACVLMAFGGLIWFVPPMVARFLYEKEILALTLDNPSNASYAYIATKLLPNGMLGIMIAAMFAATMSSMDTGLNGQTGNIVRNLLPPLFRRLRLKSLAQSSEVLVCKLVTLALGITIITYALLFSTAEDLILFDAFLLINSVIGIPLGFPLLVAVYVKKIPSWSYFLIFAFCMVPSLWSFLDDRIYGNAWTIQHRTLLIFLFGGIATLICRIFYEQSTSSSKSQAESFFQQMLTPVDFAKEVGQSNNYEQLHLVSLAVIATGGLMHLLLLVPNPWTGRLGVLFVAWFILLVGLLMRQGARHEKNILMQNAKISKS